MNRLILAAGILCFLLFSSTSAAATPISDPALGYSLDIPDNWKEISRADIDARLTSAIKPGTVSFAAGYEPASHRTPFTSPYILVISSEYGPGKSITTISEDELRSLVAGITGMSTADVKRQLAPTAATALVSVDTMTATYFTSPPGFFLDASMKAATGLTIHDHAIGLMARDRVIQIHCYALESEFAASKPTFDAVTTSFKLDPAQQITLKTNPLSRANIGLIAGVGAGVLVVALLTAGIIVFVVVKASRKRT